MRIYAIAILAHNRAIGHQNRLLWHLPEDLERFKTLTSGHFLLMGRKTFESIGRILPNRTHIVLSSAPERCSLWGQNSPFLHWAAHLEQGLEIAKNAGAQELFVIGGAAVYAQTLPICERLYLSFVDKAHAQADAFFPAWGQEWVCTEEQPVLGSVFGEFSRYLLPPIPNTRGGNTQPVLKK
jgi:dihydrofolate reductase